MSTFIRMNNKKITVYRLSHWKRNHPNGSILSEISQGISENQLSVGRRYNVETDVCKSPAGKHNLSNSTNQQTIAVPSSIVWLIVFGKNNIIQWTYFTPHRVVIHCLFRKCTTVLTYSVNLQLTCSNSMAFFVMSASDCPLICAC